MAPPRAKRLKIALPERQSERTSSKYSWMQNLLEELVLHILAFLDIDDIVRVAQTCSRLNWIVKRSKDPWKKAFLFYNFHKSDVLTAMAASTDTTVSSMARSIFLLHKKVERNLIRGRFSKEIPINYTMPGLPDYRFGKVLTLREISLTQFEVSVWNPASKTRLLKQWPLPYVGPFKCIYLSSVLAFEDSEVGVVHAGVFFASNPNIEKHIFFGFRIVENGPIKDLWNDYSLSPGGRCQVGRVGQYVLRIRQEPTVLDHWDLTQMDPLTGQALKTYRINGVLRWDQTSTLSCHDDSWLIVTTFTSNVWNNDRVGTFTTVNVHEKSSKLLDQFPNPPTDGFFAYDDIHVKDGQVFVLLRDMRIPVWDAPSGNLIRIYTIPAVPNSIRGIVPTLGYVAPRGLQVFIQTNKTDQPSWKSSIEFSMFEPNIGSDEMSKKLCSSFRFDSRTFLRRIRPTDILATDFAYGHFVVVYVKNSPTQGAINIAVMSNNSNNDLGNLKISRLMSFPNIHRVNRNRFDVKITPTHIIVACVKLMVILDFASVSNEQN